MEIVAEMDAVAAAATASQQQNVPKQRGQPNSAAALRSTADEVQEIESKHKRQALVAESVALLNKLANRGHVKSQYFLADCYTQGIGTPKGKRDYDKAFNLFLLAGKHGHSDACYRAAQCCENGWGCKRDSGKAVSLYR
jgi:TPR repeat protein